tara:strand:- start:2258 stop:2740 length:483 start_codon:yes stop_codon:yes gene_type:complete
MQKTTLRNVELDIDENWRNGPLQSRPGFLIRRLHQIHTAFFNEECSQEGITPVMYSVLSVLEKTGPIDQTTLAQSVAIDKTNMADVLERLRKNGLVKRRMSSKDRRIRLTVLTDEGTELLDRVDDKAERAHIRTLGGLTDSEQAAIMALMKKVIASQDTN